MTPRTGFWLVLLAAGTLASPAGAAPVVRTLENGLLMAVFNDPRLPIAQIQVLVAGGTAQESDREHGAAPLVAWLLARGTTSRTAAEMVSEMENLGGTISTTAAEEYASLSAAFRSADFEGGMELVADQLLNPSFADDEVAKTKNEALAALFQSRALPGLVADEHVRVLGLAGLPAAMPPLGTIESVAGLTRADLQKFHRDCYRPRGSILVVAGDVDPDRAFAAAAEYFGVWKGSARAAVAASPRASEGLSIRLVDRPDASTAEIRVGYAVPGRTSPEAAALAVANSILGGQPNSRLDASGRAFDSYSSLRLLRDVGLLVLSAVAPNDSVDVVVSRLRAEAAGLAARPPAEAEVRATARSIARTFPILNESVASQAGQWMGARFEGLGDDYVERYPARVEAVDAADVQACAAHWLGRDPASIVVVGAASALKSKLEALGPIEVVPITAPAIDLVPPPAMRLSAPTAEELRRGRELAAQAVAAHGGLTRLKGIKDSVVESDLTLYSAARSLAGTQKEMRREPWRFRMETMFPQISTVQGLDGTRGWIRASTSMDTIADQDSLSVAGLRGLFRSDPIHLLLTASDPAARLAYRGDDEIAGDLVNVVEMVAADGARWVLFLGRESHRLVGMEENFGSALAGPALRRIYGELGAEQGIVLPHSEERLLDGRRVTTLRIRRVQLNAGLPAEAFVKPGAKVPRLRGR